MSKRKLKFEGFQTGDRIRAYDFEPCEGRRDRYIIGTILEVDAWHLGALCYRVEVENDTTFYNNPRDVVFVPYECIFDYDGRVTPVVPKEATA